MTDEALELIRLRNNFYRDNYRRAIGALLVLLFINLILVGVIFYQLANRPAPLYFATSVDGKITPLYPLSDPMFAPAELAQWAASAAITTNTYNFVNYREALQRAQNNFTPEGWTSFEAALKGARTLEVVLAKKFVVSAEPTAAPVILEQGVVQGRYTWKVRIPLLVMYQNSTEQTQQPVVVTMLITRVPTMNMPKGIAITSFVAAGSEAATL
jgi:intracellular multiplication protein IcmL